MFVIFCGFLFHSSIWDISLVSRDQLRLLEDAIHDSGSCNCFSPTGAKNNINAKTLLHLCEAAPSPGDRERQPTTTQDLVTWVWGFFLSFARKQIHPDYPRLAYDHVKPIYRLTGTIKESSLGKVPVGFNAPATDIASRQIRDVTPVITTTQTSFFFSTENTLLPWSQWHGKPLLPLCPDEVAVGSWSADQKPNSIYFRKAWPCLNLGGGQW